MNKENKNCLVVATNNQDKLGEIRVVLADLSICILTRDDFPSFPEVVEDGSTLQDNAIKKARKIHLATGYPALADDTGLEVDALGGKPGVYSSRYAGETASYSDNVRKLLLELQNVAEHGRKARFRTVIALVQKEHDYVSEAVQEGIILLEPRGENGFGYDPVFYVPEREKTFAEMTIDEKNSISHRGKALQKMKRILHEHYHEVFHES